jgi:hypothetical protein
MRLLALFQEHGACLRCRHRTSGEGFPCMIVGQVLLARPRATMPDSVRVKEPITTAVPDGIIGQGYERHIQPETA